MATPVTAKFNSAVALFDPHLTQSDLTSPQSPNIPNKRRKSKSRDISKVLSDPSSPCLSLQKEKSPTTGIKTPVPSSPAMIQAQELQHSLGTEFPSCIKKMCSSQVSSGFWMGLPLWFCKSCLPKKDAIFVLEDETGQQIEAKYIAYKYGLSGGWRNFALAHNLVEEDVLVFQLVETTKFKVYIVKANESSEASHALILLNSEAHTEQTTPVTTVSPKRNKNKHPESLPLTVFEKKHKRSTPSRSVPPSRDRVRHSGPEALECSGPSEPYLFEEVKSFQDFHIMVKGICIDHELPDDDRSCYYKLCVYNNEVLHNDVPEGYYDKLVAGMIGETVRIAKKIKNCKITTTKEDFEAWDKSLSSFENLGMKVGFLRDKIHRLATLVFESEGAVDIQQYAEAENERKRAEDEIKKVAAQLKELKETAKKLEGMAGCLKQKVEEYEHKIREEADALYDSQ